MRFAAVLLAVALLAAPAAAQTITGGTLTGGSAGTAAPAVLLVVLDDVGRDQLDAYGGESDLVITMSNLDSLAAAGATATAFYASPICSPSRIAMHYGQRSIDSGEFGGPISASFDYDHDGALPEIIRNSGGAAHAHGKTGPRFPGPPESSTYAGWAPMAMGWDSYYGLTNTHPSAGFKSWTRYDISRAQFLAVPGGPDYVANPPSSTAGVTTHIDDAVVAESLIDYAARARGISYLDWIGLYQAHSVNLSAAFVWHDPAAAAPAATCGTTDEACREANLAKIDDLLGDILAARDANTYVIVVSDGGSESGNGAGGKDTLFEDGIRVPFFIVGPGVTPGSTITDRLDATDLHATLMDLLGADYTGSDGISGYSFATLIGGTCDLASRCWDDAAEHDVIVGEDTVGDWVVLSSAAPEYKLWTHTGTGDSALYNISGYTGTGPETTDLCGGDGDCTGITGANATAYNALCARISGHADIGSGCPAL